MDANEREREKKILFVTTLCVELSREIRAFSGQVQTLQPKIQLLLALQKKTRKLSDIAIPYTAMFLFSFPGQFTDPYKGKSS